MAQADSPGPIETRLFINNEFQPGADGKVFNLINPYTQEIVPQVHEAGEQDVNKAVAAAKAAFPTWRDLSPAERGVHLRKMAELIRESQPELARLESISTGKPVSSYFDAKIAEGYFSYFAEAGWNVQGSSSLNTPGNLNLTVKQHYGVVACIIPWNIPIGFFALKLAPALAAGNTVVLKSSEKAPLTSAFAAKLAVKAGFPPGVINVISGFGSPAGSTLASHMDVRCLSFTGSTRTGQKIQAAAAMSNMKTVHLELGGKSPAIVFEDADLESAAQQTQFSIQLMSGQSCMANSRIYVQESVAEKFRTLFKENFSAAANLGNPLDPSISHGPQVDKIQYDRVKTFLAVGEKDGKLTMGGDGRDGLFIKPTVFENDSQIMKEEIFGPVVVINTFSTEAEAIEKASNIEFGLYVSVFTRNLDRAVRFSKLLEAGTFGINCTSPSIANDMPFGGFKMSGLGREGFMHGLYSYLETKTILIKMGA
ncbi:aldehyde dehydrogenase [Aspergillus steynii IBT 23096]|uniref:aldehyde dehydrogenase (NAD(+)) n=1 Tax=Aspergillus steynii IBT 23096 TaxID=1392250 RepID=A0A2I2G1J2_9EURO|nr:aldehyde dehydrogenase [Aspergillus steynii IBT 23096]PLB46754.1 aldehyde dehydrogenase [Aspergillus steynii IBT 23096]